MVTIQRYCRLKNEYGHYERRYQMLTAMKQQKHVELINLTQNIQQLLSLDSQTMDFNQDAFICIHDHGDYSSMSSIVSVEKRLNNDDDDSDDDDNDPLLQRLKLTKPARLKISKLTL